MNSAKHVTALWKEQYYVSLQPVGLPGNASAQVMVDNSIVTLNGTAPYNVWVDAYAPFSIRIQSSQIQEPNMSYVYSGMQVDNQSVTGELTITRPLVIMVLFTGIPKDSVNTQLGTFPIMAAAPGIPAHIWTITRYFHGIGPN